MENAILPNEDNSVIVGQKSTMNYVVACVT